jgi:acetyltransferase-like isoleucine patch superfamily enzyme
MDCSETSFDMAVGYFLGQIGRWWFGRNIPGVPKDWILNGWPMISQAPNSKIVLGARIVLTSWSRYTALGVAHPVILRTLAPGAEIVIGDDTGLSGTTICAQTSVRVGARCLFGADVTIVDTDFHPIAPQERRFKPLSASESRPVVIEDNVFIGGSSMILKGVTIGRNSVVGAGSIVTRSIPENVIAAGNPCRVVREIEAP